MDTRQLSASQPDRFQSSPGMDPEHDLSLIETAYYRFEAQEQAAGHWPWSAACPFIDPYGIHARLAMALGRCLELDRSRSVSIALLFELAASAQDPAPVNETGIGMSALAGHGRLELLSRYAARLVAAEASVFAAPCRLARDLSHMGRSAEHLKRFHSEGDLRVGAQHLGRASAELGRLGAQLAIALIAAGGCDRSVDAEGFVRYAEALSSVHYLRRTSHVFMRWRGALDASYGWRSSSFSQGVLALERDVVFHAGAGLRSIPAMTSEPRSQQALSSLLTATARHAMQHLRSIRSNGGLHPAASHAARVSAYR